MARTRQVSKRVGMLKRSLCGHFFPGALFALWLLTLVPGGREDSRACLAEPALPHELAFGRLACGLVHVPRQAQPRVQLPDPIHHRHRDEHARAMGGPSREGPTRRNEARTPRAFATSHPPDARARFMSAASPARASRRHISHEVTVGASFGKADAATHHTLRYSFKPTNVQWAKRGSLAIRGEGATLTMPSTSASGSLVFRGKVAPPKTSECVLIYRDGKYTLERLRSNVLHLKAEREDPGPQMQQRSSRRTGVMQAPSAETCTGAADASGDEEDIDPAALFGDDDDDETFSD